MVEFVQRITVYTVKLGVSDENSIGKIAVVDGKDKRAKDDLARFVWLAFESDPNLNKLVLRRTAIPANQAT